jgi:hypothetical protein
VRRAAAPNVVHRTVLVEHGSLRAEIDEALAPLVVETWKAGVSTHCSCEDPAALGEDRRSLTGYVQLGFPCVAEAQAWVRIVRNHERSGGAALYNRMTHRGIRGEAGWQYAVSAYDAAYDYAADRSMGPSALDFLVFVYVPRADLPTVLRRLEAHNSRRE